MQLQWLSHGKIGRTLPRPRDVTRQFRNAMCNFVSGAAREVVGSPTRVDVSSSPEENASANR
jgi:hypothetical protein